MCGRVLVGARGYRMRTVPWHYLLPPAACPQSTHPTTLTHRHRTPHPPRPPACPPACAPPQVHAEGEAEHAAIGHNAVLSLVPREHIPLLSQAMADHDRDFAAFYNRLSELLEGAAA